MALGASSQEITRDLIGRGVRFVAIGVLGGIGGATAAAGLMRNLLFGVDPRDPVTLGAVALLLALVAVGAILVPVRRATQLDPARVLSAE